MIPPPTSVIVVIVSDYQVAGIEVGASVTFWPHGVPRRGVIVAITLAGQINWVEHFRVWVSVPLEIASHLYNQASPEDEINLLYTDLRVLRRD